MEAATNGIAEKSYAVVTRANKGIGFEICRQLASHGIVVVLTGRDEKKGLDALEKLKGSGFSDNVVFHELNVADSFSVASFAEFIKSQFGRLDILVNNAGITGVSFDVEALSAASKAAGRSISNDWARGLLNNTDNLTEERIDEVVNEFLKDFKEGSLEAKGRSSFLPANIVSKAAMKAYTRILAKKDPNMKVNCPSRLCQNGHKLQHWQIECGRR